MPSPLVLARQGPPPPWAERLAGARVVTPASLPSGLSDIDSVWIDATGLQPLDVARRVAERDAAVQAVVVAPPEDMGLHERALLFTPGLGEIWLMAPDDVGSGSHERAVEVTRTRRRYRDTQGRMTRMMQESDRRRPRRAIISDAYLSALLQVLPDPVISVDENDRVISWSDAAEGCFGVPRRAAVGRPAVELLEPEDPSALAEALEGAWEDTVRREMSFGGARQRLIMEVVITPVDAGGLQVRALVLRNVTRERESLKQLEREVELRSRFYAAMSHEIRTPINAIMGYNELLRTGAGGEDKRAHYLDRSQKAAQHLLELVNDVLDLSKLESGLLEIQPEPTRVDEVIHDLVVTLEPLARERETPLEIHCEPNGPVLWTDPRRLKQILMNLISNALKFSEQKPVQIRCAPSGEDVAFEVADRGKGIAPEDLDRIFEEFVQVGGPDEGTGLGLPISRKLALLLGGEIEVDSQQGEGSTFRLRLPLRHGDGATLPSPQPQTPE